MTFDDHRIEASAGTFLALPEHTKMTVENVPGPGHPYEARAIALPRDEVEAAYAAAGRQWGRVSEVVEIRKWRNLRVT